MNRELFVRTLRAQRLKLAIASLAIAAWSLFLPVIYQSFGSQMEALIESGVIPEQFTTFGGGDVFTLSGSVALGYIHPISIILVAIFAIGFAAAAVAGERQRGTLEVILARPISRRTVYVTLLVALVLFIGVLLAASIAGTVIGATVVGVADELAIDRLPLLWLNGLLMWAAFGAIGLAASVSFDRLTPALGITLAVVIVSYFLEILGSLWPDAEVLQPYSLFHYLAARDVLNGDASLGGFVLLAAVIAAAVAWALVIFPRRDLAAPS
jgi:ABC-2 type transport system permease protein